MIGKTIGPYEVVAKLGEGGMGEVYRARDTQLGRDVAIKVLPESMAGDPDRMARFQREAESLAALNHPNIAAIYGIAGDRTSDVFVRALVMELVEGEDLSARIAHGPMPLAEALPIARQIADAVDAAHARGIIHRDLKPANIKVREDGMVKVLDFGLAKAIEPDPGTAGPLDPNNSPTLTARATQMGMILGTAAYMAPEQAKGKHVDERVDVWAFGVVLFEMLAGKRPFEGDDVTEVMARVIDREPDWTLLPAATPGAIRRLLRRCLVKARHDRLRDIGDARLEIVDVDTGVAEDGASDASGGGIAPDPGVWQRIWPWVAGLVAVGVTMVATWLIASAETTPEKVRKFTIEMPADPNFAYGDTRAIAISPSGQYVATVVRKQLFLRSIDKTEATPIAGTIDAQYPFFSPDSQKLGFWVDGQVKWTTITGAPPVVVGPLVPGPSGLSWGADGFIYASLWRDRGIVRLPETGGTPDEVFQIAGRSTYGPQLLPGGEWLLFTLAVGTVFDDTADIVAKSMTSDQMVVLEHGLEGRATPQGQLFSVRGNVLFARPFDARRVEVSGSPVAVVEGVRMNGRRMTGAAQYDVAADGTLVYVPGGGSRDAVQLAWVDRSGLQEEPLPIEALQILDLGLALSPRATQIAARREDLNQIWLFSVDRPGGRQLTATGANVPVWSHDGDWVFFRSGDGIWKQRADLSGDAVAVDLGSEAKPGIYFPSAVSRDGQYLFVNYSPSGATLGFGRLSLTGREPRLEMLIEATADRNSGFASPSPDGRFVAYAAGPSFNPEVWMMEARAGGKKTRISPGAGDSPRWTTRNEVVFVNGSDVMSATVETEPELAVTDVRALHRREDPTIYDVTQDGRRFLHTVRPSAGSSSVSVVLNVFEELKGLRSAR